MVRKLLTAVAVCGLACGVVAYASDAGDSSATTVATGKHKKGKPPGKGKGKTPSTARQVDE